MFLHSGASLHGHEYTTPHPRSNNNTHRKKPFLRSSLPAPILRSNTTDLHQLPSQKHASRRRPASELYTRPIFELLTEDDPSSPPAPASPSASGPIAAPASTPATSPASARTRISAPSHPVVRFKETAEANTPKSPSSSMTEEAPSLYESDVSQATASTPRRRQPRLPRKSTAYLVAVPAPKRSIARKAIFKTARPRLLLQLQETAASQRPKPTLDVYPASLIAGSLLTARHINRFPRLFGSKAELGLRDLILLRSEDYAAHVDNDDDDEDESAHGQRQPLAVLSLGRGPENVGEVVLDDGSIWTCSSHKGHFSFVHNDETGASLTVRWVKRNPNKNLSNPPASVPGSHLLTPGLFPAGSSAALETEYQYSFSIINPFTRRHPVLATLSPQALEIYEDYTTPSASSGRYPLARPMSGTFEPTSPGRDQSPSTPSSRIVGELPPPRRETHPVDEDTKKLIMVTGLWLALQLGPAAGNHAISPGFPESSGESAFASFCTTASHSRESSFAHVPPAGSIPAANPRRSTMSSATPAQTPTSPHMQPKGLRRAMSTGAAFLQRRRRQVSSEAPGSVVSIDVGGKTSERKEASEQVGAAMEAAVQPGPSADVNVNVAAPWPPQQRHARRVSWFKRLVQ